MAHWESLQQGNRWEKGRCCFPWFQQGCLAGYYKQGDEVWAGETEVDWKLPGQAGPDDQWHKAWGRTWPPGEGRRLFPSAQHQGATAPVLDQGLGSSIQEGHGHSEQLQCRATEMLMGIKLLLIQGEAERAETIEPGEGWGALRPDGGKWEDKDRPSPVASRERAHNNRHWYKIFLLTTVPLDQALHRGYGSSFTGDAQNLHRLPLSWPRGRLGLGECKRSLPPSGSQW